MSSSPLDLLVERAIQTAQKRWIRLALTGYLILFSGLVGERLVSAHDTGQRRADNAKSRQAIVQTGTVALIDGCNGRFEDRTALRDILISTRREVVKRLKNPQLTNEQRQQLRFAKQFYDARLDKLPLPDCRNQLDVISADPDAVVILPEPKYPPAAG